MRTTIVAVFLTILARSIMVFGEANNVVNDIVDLRKQIFDEPAAADGTEDDDMVEDVSDGDEGSGDEETKQDAEQTTDTTSQADADEEDDVLIRASKLLTQMRPFERVGNIKKFNELGVKAAVLLQLELAHHLQNEGRVDESRVLYESLLRLSPSNWDGLTHLGELLLTQGDVNESEQQFRKALALRPDKEMSWENVVQTMRQRGANDDSPALVSTALQHFGFEPDLPTAPDFDGRVERFLSSAARDKSAPEQDRHVMAWAAGNHAMYHFLKSAEATESKGFDLAEVAMELWWSDFAMWPWHCATYARTFLPSQNETLDKSKLSELKKGFVQRWASEDRTLKDRGTSAALVSIIDDLRKLECSGTFIHELLLVWYAAGSTGSKKVAGGLAALKRSETTAANGSLQRYSSHNFWYGTFFYSTFMDMAEHKFVAPYIHGLKENNGQYMVLGSNVGNEVFYGALTFDVETVGIEILCNLVEHAENLKQKFCPDANIRFVCSDAMAADVSRAMVVYIDNEVWEEWLTKALFEKLGRELPSGAIVIAYHRQVLMEPWQWKEGYKTVTAEASWGKTTMYVFEKKKGKKTAQPASNAAALARRKPASVHEEL